MSQKLKGIAASDGIALAPLYCLEKADLSFNTYYVKDPDREKERLLQAIEASKQEIDQLRSQACLTMGEEEAKVFDAHQLMLEDPEFLQAIYDKILNEHLNAEAALQQVCRFYLTSFEAMTEDDYMKERSMDIRDVSQRLMAQLLGKQSKGSWQLNQPAIIVAHDLTPSDTAQLDPRFVKAFVTEVGGRTSHSAIMARSLGIPAIVGVKDLMVKVKGCQHGIVDAISGHFILKPSLDEQAVYQAKINQLDQESQQLQALIHKNTQSKDGVKVELAANIGRPEDLEMAIKNGAEGIGLYRTEFLYMDSDTMPSEEAQFKAYKFVLEKMAPKQVVVRTMDIGGDKTLPYMTMPQEMNPFLGYRAIRLCLDQEALFRMQLRALLRASIYGQLRIMFPMIASLDEFRQAKRIFESVKEELIQQGHSVSSDIQLGMMIEIPAAALLADHFAKEVDFFSIGTNDLIQYTMAADRMNERISYLYQPFNPSILRLIKFVIDAAHKEGKWVGMCGEMAGEAAAAPLLLAMGLDEFSMSAASILKQRHLIRKLDSQVGQSILDRILNETCTQEEVQRLLEAIIAES